MFQMSPESESWMHEHRDALLKRLQHGTKREFVEAVLNSPQHIKKVHGELASALQALGAPSSVLAEWETLGQSLVQGRGFSAQEREALLELMPRLDEQDATEAERLSLVRAAQNRGKISERVATALASSISEAESKRTAKTLYRFNVHACVFCGALGVVDGGAGGVVACIVCGFFG